MDASHNPLELFPTDDLVEELERRFSSSIFVATGAAKDHSITIHTSGNLAEVLGLASIAQHKAISLIRPVETE